MEIDQSETWKLSFKLWISENFCSALKNKTLKYWCGGSYHIYDLCQEISFKKIQSEVLNCSVYMWYQHVDIRSTKKAGLLKITCTVHLSAVFWTNWTVGISKYIVNYARHYWPSAGKVVLTYSLHESLNIWLFLLWNINEDVLRNGFVAKHLKSMDANVVWSGADWLFLSLCLSSKHLCLSVRLSVHRSLHWLESHPGLH